MQENRMLQNHSSKQYVVTRVGCKKENFYIYPSPHFSPLLIAVEQQCIVFRSYFMPFCFPADYMLSSALIKSLEAIVYFKCLLFCSV